VIRLADLRIRRKLALTTAFVSGVALSIASLAFLLFDRASFEEALVRRLRTVAEVVAWNGAPAVVFRDPDSARTTLSALRSEPEVLSAAFYDRDGLLFADFRRAEDVASPAPVLGLVASGRPSQAILDDELVVMQPVQLEEERVGTLVIRSSLRERAERSQRVAVIAATVFAASMLLAALVGWIVQRTLSEPLLELADTARRMSREGDLSARARPPGRDEVGALVDSFNTMLDGLQRRDQDLQNTHAELERRIEEGAELYRRAEEANRLKDEFLATLSHELRTPLNAIVGWASILERGADPATLRKAAEAISRNALTQGQLIADILDMQRISSGKLTLSLAPLELSPVVDAGVDTVRPVAAAKGIAIETTFEPDAGTVLGDHERLQQVVWNLVSNAVKFAAVGGHVAVGLSRADNHVQLTVEDDGPGLAPEFIPFAFDRFRQGDSSTTRRHGGLGLGLAIVKNLVELHGGRVSAGNRTDGTGAIFTVRLPAVAIGASRGEPAGRSGGVPSPDHVVSLEEAPSLAGVRVLVVEDDADSRELAAAVLRRCGADVTTLGSAEGALELVRRERPDVLLSDIAMPGEDGLAMLRRLRRLPPGEGGLTPAVALTAHASTEQRIMALAAGFQILVPKPVQPAELVAVVAILAGHSAMQSRRT
jgi:signal transduction histidine kinase/ActR/RegA family two-component response regulator